MPKTPGANLTTIVREALDSVVTPSVRNAILDRALRAARRPQLPTDTEELDAFVQGPLHDTLLATLGSELGASVAAELTRVIAAARVSATQAEKRKVETVRPRRSMSRPKQAAAERTSRSTMPSRQFPANEPKTGLVPTGGTPREPGWLERQRRAVAPTLPATERVIPVKETPGTEAERRKAQTPPAPDESNTKGSTTRTAPSPQRPAVPQPTSTDYPRGTAAALGVIGTTSLKPTASARPTIFVATTDATLHGFFQAWLDLRAAVEPVSSATALMTRVSEIGSTRAVVVLDGRNPSIRPLSLAALGEELPPETKVVLWGVPTHVHAKMCSVSVLAERWLVYAGQTTPDELVAECARILG
jgi:hypothetical protein